MEEPTESGAERQLPPDVQRLLARMSARLDNWPPQPLTRRSPVQAKTRDLLEVINEQRDRMVAAHAFVTGSGQEAIFKFLVEEAVKGNEIGEKHILEKFFPSPPHPKDSTIARTTMVIRKRIEKYYKGVGRFDPLEITFPVKRKQIGQEPIGTYTPVFHTTNYYANLRHYRLGTQKLASMNPNRVLEAVGSFLLALDESATDHNSYVGLTEAMLAATFYVLGVKSRWIDAARIFAQRATELEPEHWRCWAVLGAVCLVTRERSSATEYFEKALSLNKRETEDYSWYHFYLIAAVRAKEGAALACAFAFKNLTNINANVFALAALYVVRDYQAAGSHAIFCGEELGYISWMQPLMSSLLRFTAGDKDFALQSLYVNETTHRVAPWAFRFGGLVILLASYADPSLEPLDTSPVLERLAEELTRTFGDSFPWFQFALALMSIPLERSLPLVIECLTRAEAARDPVMLFVWTLPLLDPLREYPAFTVFSRRWAEGSLDYGALLDIETLRAQIVSLAESVRKPHPESPLTSS